MLDTQVQVDIQQAVTEETGVGPADIVVGLLSYNNAPAISAITRDTQDCLATYFPRLRGVVVHADGGSKDGTQESALASAINKRDFVQITYPIFPAQKISPEYFGVPGKGNGVQAVFGIASDLKATTCAIVDSTTGTPSRESIETL